MNEYQYHKRLKNGDFHLVGLLSLFSGFVLLPAAIMLGMTIAIIWNRPELQEILLSNDLSEEIVQAVYIFSQVIGQIPLVVATIYLARKIFIRDAFSFRNDIKNNLKIVGIGTLALFGAIVATNIVYEALGIDGVSENEQTIQLLLESRYFIFMLVATVLFAPLLEEMIFRKFMMGTMEEKFRLSKTWSIIISAFVFSLVHVLGGENFIFIFQYFPLALVICIAYSKSNNNIYVAIGIHFINNALAAILTFLV